MYENPATGTGPLVQNTTSQNLLRLSHAQSLFDSSQGARRRNPLQTSGSSLPQEDFTRTVVRQTSMGLFPRVSPFEYNRVSPDSGFGAASVLSIPPNFGSKTFMKKHSALNYSVNAFLHLNTYLAYWIRRMGYKRH